MPAWTVPTHTWHHFSKWKCDEGSTGWVGLFIYHVWCCYQATHRRAGHNANRWHMVRLIHSTTAFYSRSPLKNGHWGRWSWRYIDKCKKRLICTTTGSEARLHLHIRSWLTGHYASLGKLIFNSCWLPDWRVAGDKFQFMTDAAGGRTHRL